ncbi:N-6 DNA methylase [Xylocopilactobacillus apis]|uniref:DNA methylase adenine-specific domain-containing protein n=1 Tax=Xylocopilactobacillus apis TaxID=2932183 RepID=A0AAU9DF87_9LACO|nr:N-6 DNA methylase [Xylocopilactobacillus apis]BDR56896.1 hypothetical protein KIMC2_14580 [Xylocopilactobacillus apis]
MPRGKFDLETVNKLLGVDESYKAPDKLLKIMFDKKKREKLFREFLDVSTDVSYDWFHEYFQDEQAERKTRKQDFTPTSISNILSILIKNPETAKSTYDVAAGTGGMTIVSWWNDMIQESPFFYLPQEHLFYCEELSDRAMPFLLFNLAIRGMNAVVWQGDSLARTCKGVFLIENPTDNHMGFSDINTMPRTDDVKRYFEIDKWVGDPYPEHIETDMFDWAKAMDKSVQDRQKTFEKYSNAFNYVKERTKSAE